jgi:flagellar motility protein MotE (MotC chaperone)
MIDLDPNDPVNDEPAFDGPPEDGPIDPDAEEEEMRLLRLLEEAEREIGRAKDAKKADMDAHNEGIKALENKVEGLLASLVEHRLGERSLPLE